MKKAPIFLYIVLFFCLVYTLNAQVSARRYSFAKSYFGIDVMNYPSFKNAKMLNMNGQLQDYTASGGLIPSVNIGGTHFWGYADFYVTINLVTITTSKQPLNRYINYGALTGMRLYPWHLKEKAIRPFVGYKFSPVRLIHEGSNERSYSHTKVKSMLDIGIGYTGKSKYAYLSFGHLPSHRTTLFLDRTVSSVDRFPVYWIQGGINIQIETTAGSYTKEIREMDSLFSSRNIAGLFFAAGPSSAFPTQSSSYNQTFYPFLDDRAMPSIFPELSMGYHLSKTDLAFAVNFRPIFQTRSAFDFDQKIRRISFGVELFKYFCDFHGFAPFVGVGMSGDFITLQEYEGGINTSKFKNWQTTPHLVYGWDIRPSRKADIWLLRTNLRYSPWQKIRLKEKEISLQYNEFNFIQLVIYPQRIKIYHSKSK